MEKGKAFRITATSSERKLSDIEIFRWESPFSCQIMEKLLQGSAGGKIEIEITADASGNSVTALLSFQY